MFENIENVQKACLSKHDPAKMTVEMCAFCRTVSFMWYIYLMFAVSSYPVLVFMVLRLSRTPG